ncbi:MAG: hypothetical protein BGO29_00735 [Bacteroidales bacterium 36-12]|jgi:hypothetical protein|nr:MAG: hypothetical protein BGO29_00735 [Bacteroidales bacterium 36-12]
MKKIILLLSMLPLFTIGSYADDELWADINFTRDSVFWGQGTEPPQPNNQNYQNVEFGDYTINGFFGRFNNTMRKLNSENLEEQFIMSWRLSRNAANQFVFPEYDNVGRFKMHFFNTSTATGCYFYLQYRTGFDDNDNPVWSSFDPEIKIPVDASDGSASSVVIDTALNIDHAIQLRIAPITYQEGGSGNYYLQVFAVSISKYEEEDPDPDTGVNTTQQVEYKVLIQNRTLQIDAPSYQATVYHTSGVKIGTFSNNQSYHFDLPGQYIVKIETAQGTVVKKLAVF